VLGAAGEDGAGVQHIGGVVEFFAVPPGAADEDAGAAIGGVGGEFGDGGLAGGDEGGFADEILGGVAGDEHLRRDHEIGAEFGGAGAGAADGGEVVDDLADMRVDLGEGDPERIGRRVGHGAGS
jgi:hypothetical protein